MADSIFTSILALAFVLGLIGLANLALRRFGPEKWIYRVAGAKKSDVTMKISEVLILDAKRRLVRVTREGTEYVLLLGLNGEQVVETVRTAPARKGKSV